MACLDISTEDWTLWQLVMQAPNQFPVRVKIRAPSRDEAMQKAVETRGDGWRVALDACGNPLIWREERWG